MMPALLNCGDPRCLTSAPANETLRAQESIIQKLLIGVILAEGGLLLTLSNSPASLIGIKGVHTSGQRSKLNAYRVGLRRV